MVYLRAEGKHAPACGGRCLVPDVDGDPVPDGEALAYCSCDLRRDRGVVSAAVSKGRPCGGALRYALGDLQGDGDEGT